MKILLTMMINLFLHTKKAHNKIWFSPRLWGLFIFFVSFSAKAQSVCPTITNIGSSKLAICSGESINISVNVSDNSQIAFVRYSASIATPYNTIGATLGTATPANGAATLNNIILPANNGAVPVVHYIYGMLTAIPGDANCRPYQVIQITVNPKPVISIQSAIICEGGSSAISASASGATAYKWSGPAGFSSTLQSPTISNATTAMSGTYSVTVTGTGDCTASRTLTVSITPMQILNDQAVTFCPGGSATLNADAGVGATYLWNTNETGSAITVTQAGTYTVAMTGSNGCKSKVSFVVILKPIPTINALSNTPVCVGNTLTLSASGGGSYQWAGPGFSSTLQNPTRSNAVASMSGTYTALITGTNSCTASSTLSVTVVPSLSITANPNIVLCSGNSLNLSATNIVGAIYQWSGPSSFASTLQNPVLSGIDYSMRGIYSVTVRSGSCSASATTSADISAVPLGQVQNNSPICEGATLNLSASGGITYQWTGPAGFSSTLQSPTRANATTAFAGEYTVTIKNAGNCTALAKVTATVESKPIPNITSNSPLCTGSTLNLSTSVGKTYQWSGAVNFSSTLQLPTRANVTSAMSGVYSVTVANGLCSATATTNVQVSQQGATASGTNTCEGATLSLNASTGGSYQWSGPAGFSSTLQNPTRPNASIGMTGVYSVTIGGTSGCTGTTTVSIRVIPTPPGTAANSGGGDFVCVGSSLSLIGGGGTSFQWTGPDGFTSTAQNPSITTAITTAMAGVYTVKVTDSNSCTVTATTSVPVRECKTCKDTTIYMCLGESFTLTAETGIGNVQWYKDDKAIAGATGSSFVVKEAGSYYYKGETDTKCPVEYCCRLIFKISPNPTIKASNNSPVCFGLPLSLSASGGTSYSWLGSGGFIATGATPSLGNATADMNGVYTVTGKDDNGCSATATTSVSTMECLGSIGDYVWKDTNANGIQDGAEIGVAGVKIILYKEVSGVFVKADSLTTAASGKYIFSSLQTGNYKVQFIYNNPDCVLTTPTQGTDNTKDSDAGVGGFTSVIKIDTSLPVTDIGRNNPTIDAGYITPYGSIGDYVWKDTNANGIQDGAEIGVAGVKVILYKEVSNVFTKVDSVTTVTSGQYLFGSLLSGNYKVQFIYNNPDCVLTTSTQGTDNTKDSDAGVGGFTSVIKIDTNLPVTDIGRNNPTIDAGYITPYGSIGDYVWKDNNGNGIQDASEQGIAGVKVILYKEVSNVFTKVDSLTTGTSGKYSFGSLLSGNYKVQFVYYNADCVQTATKQGTDNTKDSDAGVGGFTSVIKIDTNLPVTDIGRNNTTIDAGYIPACQLPELSVEQDKAKICMGESVTIKGIATGAKIRWYLSAVGGTAYHTSNSGEDWTVSPTSTITYYAEAYISDNCVSSVRKPVTIEVNAKPATPSCAGSTTNICPATYVDLTLLKISELSTIGGTFEWHTGPLATSSLVTNIKHITYSGKFYLFERSTAGCYSNPSIVVVNIIPCACETPAIANAGDDISVCGIDTIRLAGTVLGSAQPNIGKWTTDGSGKFGNSYKLNTYYIPSADDAAKGYVHLILTTLDDNFEDTCEPTEDAMTVTLNQIPDKPFGLTCADSVLCLGSKTRLYGFSNNGKIRWFTQASGGIAIGEMAIGEGMDVSPTITTTYWAETISDKGCISTLRTPITVYIKKCLTDLAVEKKILTLPPYKKGQTVEYAITVNNLGPVEATNVVMTDKLPTALTFVSSVPPSQYDPTSGKWAIGTLTAGSNRTLTIKATINNWADILNVAYVTSPENDLTKTSNDTSSVFISTKASADLSLRKTVSDAKPYIGDVIQYIVEVKNDGPNVAHNIEITDYLPSGVTFVSSTSFKASGNKLTVTLDSLIKGEKRLLIYAVKVTKEGTWSNRVEITNSDIPDPDSTPNNGVGKGEDDEATTDINATTKCETLPPVLSCSTTNLCGGDSIRIYATGCVGTIIWNGGLSGIDNILVSPKTTTTYWAICVNAKCVSDTAKVEITVGNPKQVILSCTNTSICNGTNTIIKALGCENGTIIWSNGMQGTSITVKPTLTTTYIAYCKVGTCLSEDSKGMTINVTTEIPKPIIKDLVNICPLESVSLWDGVLSKPATKGGVFTFYTGNKTIYPVVADPTKVTKTGTYYIVEKSVIGCTSTPMPINVLITKCTPTDPCADNPAKANAGTDAEVCIEKHYQLKGIISGAASSSTWTTSGTGTFDNPLLTNATYNVSQEDITKGYIWLVLTTNDPDGVAGGCRAGIDSMKLVVSGVALKPNVIVTGSLNLCAGGSTTLTVAQKGYKCFWNTKDTTASITVTKAGIYTVKLLTANGCTSVSCDPIEITVGDAIVAPIVQTNISNSCPSPYADLTKAVIGLPSTPNGTFEYRIGESKASAKILNPASVSAGTYYVCERSELGCYSASTKMIVIPKPCNTVIDTTNLSLSFTASMNKANVGDQVTYTITVTNTGAVAAHHAEVINILPAELTFISGNKVAYNEAVRKVTASFDTIGAGKSISVSFVVRAAVVGNVENRADIIKLDEVDKIVGDNISITTLNIVNPIPNNKPLLGLAKYVVNYTVNDDNSVHVKYGFVLKNYGLGRIDSLQILDTLSSFYSAGTQFRILEKVTSQTGILKPNSSYNGTTDPKMLLTNAGGYLDAGQSDTLSFTVLIMLNPLKDSSLTNVATAIGVRNGIWVGDISTDGKNPDPLGSGNPGGSSRPTKINTYTPPPANSFAIPEGFSPNGDGVNDKFIIKGITATLKTNLTVYDVWGVRVYESEDYKNDWDGTANVGVTPKFLGQGGLPDGTYYYVAELSDGRRFVRYLTIAR